MKPQPEVEVSPSPEWWLAGALSACLLLLALVGALP